MPSPLPALNRTSPPSGCGRACDLIEVFAVAARRTKHLPIYRNAMSTRPHKIFMFPKFRTHALNRPSRARYGGRFAIVTTRGAGCDGRIGVARRARSMRTVKPCGTSAAPPSGCGRACDLIEVLRSRHDGQNTCRFTEMRCQPIGVKICVFPKFGMCALSVPSRLDKRGVRPIVTEREAGCDGRGRAARRVARPAYGQAVWS